MNYVSNILHHITSYYIMLLIVRALVLFVREHLANPAVKFYLCKFVLCFDWLVIHFTRYHTSQDDSY